MYFSMKGVVFLGAQKPLKGGKMGNRKVDFSPIKDSVGFYQFLAGTGAITFRNFGPPKTKKLNPVWIASWQFPASLGSSIQAQ